MHRLAAREVNRHGRFRRALRRLAACGCQTADGIPTPIGPGRGGHGTMRGPLSTITWSSPSITTPPVPRRPSELTRPDRLDDAGEPPSSSPSGTARAGPTRAKERGLERNLLALLQ